MRRILQENADHVLDSLTAGAKEAAQDGRFGDAIQVFGRHNIPSNLMPPLLNTLIKRRARLLREDAARYVEERRKHVWALLDHDARDRALDVAEEVKNKLGVPELMRQVEAFRRSARMAKDFLEPFQKLDALRRPVL